MIIGRLQCEHNLQIRPKSFQILCYHAPIGQQSVDVYAKFFSTGY